MKIFKSSEIWIMLTVLLLKTNKYQLERVWPAIDFVPNLFVNYLRLKAKFDLPDFAVDSIPFK